MLIFLSPICLVVCNENQRISQVTLGADVHRPKSLTGPNVHMAACISRHIRPKFFEKNLTLDNDIQ